MFFQRRSIVLFLFPPTFLALCLSVSCITVLFYTKCIELEFQKSKWDKMKKKKPFLSTVAEQKLSPFILTPQWHKNPSLACLKWVALLRSGTSPWDSSWSKQATGKTCGRKTQGDNTNQQGCKCVFIFGTFQQYFWHTFKLCAQWWLNPCPQAVIILDKPFRRRIKTSIVTQ